MPRTKHAGRLEGWPLLGWLSLLLCTGAAIVVAIAGTGEFGLRTAIRISASSSLALFLATFVASAAVRAWPSRTSKWLLRNRRYLGLSFAVSQLIHAGFIVALGLGHTTSFWANVAPSSLIGGGFGYLLIALMVATSFDRTSRWLGGKRWRALHRFGMYFLWFVFLSSYAGRATAALSYCLLTAALLASLALRVYVRFGSGRGPRRRSARRRGARSLGSI